MPSFMPLGNILLTLNIFINKECILHKKSPKQQKWSVAQNELGVSPGTGPAQYLSNLSTHFVY